MAGCQPRPLTLSVVSPVYRAEAMIDELVERIVSAAGPVEGGFELILVDDASEDGSWQHLCRWAHREPRLRACRLSRNFGQHATITAGLSLARGEWIVVMDCDLQDRPEEIPRLYAKALEGFDVVVARRRQRRDGPLRELASRLFYSGFAYLTGTRQDASVANFGIYHRRVIAAVLSMGDRVRFFPAMVRWVGFRRTELWVEHANRRAGRSTYDLRRLTRLALDSSLAHSDKPLRIILTIGFFVTLGSLFAAMALVLATLTGKAAAGGMAGVLLSVWLLGGMILLALGLVGLYVGSAHEQGKARPVFVIAEQIGGDEADG